MTAETVRAEAVCLDIRPWSRTSHVVSWLTASGRVTTVVKGAERPKSFLLGQYDLNYTCDIVYYARSRGEVHALREAFPLATRDGLRGSYRLLALAGYCRRMMAETAPTGPDCGEFLSLLAETLDRLCQIREAAPATVVSELLAFELRLLELLGVAPSIGGEGGEIVLRGERKMPVSESVAACLRAPLRFRDLEILLDAARVIGVYYTLQVGLSPEIRRSVLSVISHPTGVTDK